MNVNLQYDVEFMGGVYYEDTLQINNYNVSMHFVTCSKEAEVTNIAMERVKAFIFSELSNVVFINRDHETQAELFQALGCNICTLPEEPVDQIIGLMLYCKLNAIMEGQMIITDLDISSSLGDEIWYQHNEEDSLGPFSKEGWWHELSTQKETLEPDGVDKNVVKVQSTGWYEYGLDWPDSKSKETAKIVYPDFKKNETK
jgi:hypothetical protein